MLEKPDVPNDALIACLREHFQLHITDLVFLPLGADVNTAVYRAVASDGTPYFVKLRGAAFDETTVVIPHLLRTQGVSAIIAPLETRAGQLWTHLDDFAVTVSPFVAGRTGYEQHLSDRQWIDFGAALRRIHTAAVPPIIRQRIARETHSSHWRERVRMFQARVEETPFTEPVAAQAAELLRARRDIVSDLVERAEVLGNALQLCSLNNVLCHADLHAWNVLVSADDSLYIVDWDTLLIAPKERDLMFIGAGIGGIWNTERESALFYQGYGPTEIDPVALAYFRYERIIEDIAAYCEQLLLTTEGGVDRTEGLRQLAGQFQPNGVIDIAIATDPPPRAG